MFIKFPSIESFAHVVRGQARFETPATVHYGAKIKLHGTNAAVTMGDDGVIYAQSRSRMITPSDDNCGFAAWVRDTAGPWTQAYNEGPAGTVTIFGEWAGQGIQKGDAVCQLDGKYFFVFAAQVDDSIIVEPLVLEQMVPDLDNVLVLPWDRVWEEPVLLREREGTLTKWSQEMTEAVAEIAERDPFIYGIFGIEGTGEGWVVVPRTAPGGEPEMDTDFPREWYSSLAFKVKSEAHSVKKNQGAKVFIEVPQSVHDFVEMFVTEARCYQMFWDHIGGVADTVHTGRFLKHVSQDVHKESEAELEDAGLEWKDAQKHVTMAARAWFLKKCEEF
jgi:hypothetical protein